MKPLLRSHHWKTPSVLAGLLILFGLSSTFAKTLVSGTIAEDTTWTPADSPYEVTNTTLNADVTLHILPGTIVQFLDYASFHVHGRIIADGLPSEKILFTSLSGATEGNPWGAIRLTNDSGNGNGLPASQFAHCTFEGGGYWFAALVEVSGGADVSFDQCLLRHSSADGIRMFEDSGGPIHDTRIENNAGHGLWLRGSSPAVDNCVFANNGNVGRLESGAGKGSFPAFANTSFSESGYVHIASNIDSSGTLSAAPYYLDSHRSTLEGKTITIEGGASFALANYASWTIHGNLLANGTAEAPIVFSRAGDTHWGAILLSNHDGNGEGLPSRLSHCTMDGGGYWFSTLLQVYGGAPATLEHCNFRNSTVDGVRFFENSGGRTSDTRFEGNAGYGLWLRGSSPEVDSCVFANNGNVGRLESGAGQGSFPAFANTSFSESGYVHIASNIESSGTLSAAPYYLDSHRFAVEGKTITIEGGASFALANYASWTIHGNLLANGTAEAPIVFSRAGDTHWGAILISNHDGNGEGLPSRLSHCTMDGGGYWYSTLLQVYGGAPATLEHCNFRNSTADGVRFFENSGGRTSDTRFEGNAGYGLWLRGSSPEVHECIFSENGNAGRLESGAGQSSLPVFTETFFDAGESVHIAGDLDTAGTLTAAPYYIDGHRVSRSDGTLTVQAGASFAMANYASWSIHGNLIAEGTADAPIHFTRAGDTHWGAIRLTNVEGAGEGRTNRLSYCTMDGGGYWYSTLLETYGGAPVILENCNFRNSSVDNVRLSNMPGGAITDSVFEGAASHGLRLQSASPSISGSTFRACGRDGILLLSSTENGASLPAFSDNTFGPDDYVEIGSHIDTGGTLSNPGQAYLVTGTRNIRPGADLSVAPGTVVKFTDFHSLIVDGSLQALGTTQQPITFTSDDELKEPHQWGGVVFTAGRPTSSILRHCTVEAGGYWYGTLVEVSGTAAVTIDQCALRTSAADGLQILGGTDVAVSLSSIYNCNGQGMTVDSSSPEINACDLYNNRENGLYSTNASPNITNSFLRDNLRSGIRAVGGAVPTVSNCYLSNNGEFGVLNQVGVDLIAQNNWWGDPTGPHHPTLNPDGLGNPVSDRVIFQPYRLVASNVPQQIEAVLVNGESVAGTFPRGVNGYYYAVDVPAGQNLTLTLDDANNEGVSQVYMSRNAYPTPSDYQLRHEKTASDQRLFALAAGPGRWYILALQFTAESESAFSIRADMADIAVHSVSPARHANTVPITLSIEGAGFLAGTQVDLIGQGNFFNASSVEIDSFKQVVATFPGNVVLPGIYDVRVTVPDKTPATLPGAFESLEGGRPKLVTNLITPSAVGYHQLATVYLEYGNEGEASMVAPILTVTAAQNGQERAFLTLDKSRIVNGFWTSAVPRGFFHNITVLGSGEHPGILHPGEKIRVPIYYAGWQKPWDFSYPPIQFSLSILESTVSSPVDWDPIRIRLAAEIPQPEGFEYVWANLVRNIGPTWGDYVRTIAENASYLGALGRPVNDVNKLLRFEFMQADTLQPRRILSEATDVLVAAPGLPLSFNRQYRAGIPVRFKEGALGRGWTHSWQWELRELEDGTIEIESAQTLAHYQPDTRGGYLSAPQDLAKLVKQGSEFRLLQRDGSRQVFSADGSLLSVADANGNQITCGYGSGRLTSLTHSSGEVLQLTYGANNRIASISHASLGTATYQYDASGQHLVGVAYPDGRVASYAYASQASTPVHHALLSASFAGQTRQFSYDSQGRLLSENPGDPTLSTTYSYDNRGNISATDSLGNTTTLSVDETTQIAKIRAGNGALIAFQRDITTNRLTSLVAPDGASHDTLYDRGKTTVVNAQGDRSSIVENVQGLPTQIVNTNGNAIEYARDDRGNITRITYPDGSLESFAYDDRGQATQWIRRDGRSLTADYDNAGRITRARYDDGTELAYQFNNRGDLVRAANADSVLSLEYNAENLPSKLAYDDGRSIAYTYDAQGRRVSTTDHNGNVTRYRYDALGRLDQVKDGNDHLIAAYTYNELGNIHERILGNGVKAEYSYDANGRLNKLTNTNGQSNVISQFLVTRNIQGFPVSVETLEGTWNYRYDQGGQLTAADFSSIDSRIPNQTLSYTYDPMGNRIRDVENGDAFSYGVDNRDRYTNINGAGLDYDAEGNLLELRGPHASHRYTYNTEGHLISLLANGSLTTFAYDAMGNRISSTREGTTTKYLPDLLNANLPLGEYGASNQTLTHYHHGLGFEGTSGASGERYYLTFDQRGSVTEISEAGGGILNEYRYRPFGETTFRSEKVENRLRFDGRFGVQHEAGSIHFMQARYYDARLGRFHSEDPVTQPFRNHYAYGNNSPTMFHDPSGRLPDALDEDIDKLIARREFFASRKLQKIIRKEFIGQYTSAFWDFVIDTGVGGTGATITAYSVYTGNVPGIIIGGVTTGVGILWGLKDYTDIDTRKAELKKMIAEEFRKFAKEKGLKLGKDTPEKLAEILVEGGKDAGEIRSKLLLSQDPNQKLGPAGYGDAHFVAPGALLPYRVDFENDKEALAPAQVVMISDPLSEKLDWATFELTEVGFGDHLIPVPGPSQSFDWVEPMRYAGKDLEVAINIALDPVTGRIQAIFSTTDKETGLPPEVEYGFLPPEDETGRGQGYFAYTIRAQADLPTGTEIRNVATITFDFGEVIDTNQVDPHDPGKGTDPEKEALVTIDADAPTSQVTALPAQSPAAFTVQWAGEDGAGSGAGRFTLFARAGNGDFEPWLENTTATSAAFQGVDGVTYSFYAIARDWVGNEEAPKVAAETSTTVSDEGGGQADYTAWLTEHFTSQEIDGGVIGTRLADPDRDGLTNGQEFAFVSDPRSADGGSWSTVRTAGHLLFDYWRRTDGIQYRLESSADLIHWNPEGNIDEAVLATIGATEQVRATFSLDVGEDERYIRVRAEE